MVNELLPEPHSVLENRAIAYLSDWFISTFGNDTFAAKELTFCKSLR